MKSAKPKVPFDDRIAYMESHIDAFKWESCSKILVYLSIFGPMRASLLNERLGLKGEKSLYRSIKKLIQIGQVKKIHDPTDKRTSIYQITGLEINDPDFDESFIEHLVSMDKLSLISDYLAIANQSSSSFLKAVTEIMQERQKTDPNRFQKRFLASSIFYEVILSIDNASEIQDKIDQFISQEIHPYMKKIGTGVRRSIENPAALYITFMPI